MLTVTNTFSSFNFQLYIRTTLILVTTIGFKHFWQFLIFNCTCAFSTPYFFLNCCLHNPTSYGDIFIVLKSENSGSKIFRLVPGDFYSFEK